MTAHARLAGAAELAALADGARAAKRIALDTEFMGEGRYRTLLCLIQLAVPTEGGSERVELLDPLAADIDLAPLASMLADGAIQVVVHAGRQDIALVRRLLGIEVRNVFDTQVAAAFVGLGPQASYDSLLAAALDVRVAKSASFTRWDARPLSAEQLAYASDDVAHLLELASELERRLTAAGRTQWAREECEPLGRSSDERDPEAIFARLPRVRGLNGAARTVARELIAWREQLAARIDRPVQTVLSDQALVEIARRKPTTRAELQRIRGAGGGSAGRRGEEVLAVVRRARDLPPDPAPHDRRSPLAEPEDAPLVALSEALLRARAVEAGLAYELLASRADLQAIIAATRTGAEADVRTLRGWRREVVGEQLRELLAGRLSLSVRGRALHIAS